MAMDHTQDLMINPLARPAGPDEAFWLPTKRWLFRLALAAVGLGGLFHASGAPSEGGYRFGVAIFVMMALVLFLNMKRDFDGMTGIIGYAFLARRLEALWLVIPLHALMGLAGLKIASMSHGVAAYAGGVALAIWCFVAILANMKAAYDAADEQRH